jgi:MFS family permease
MSERVSERAMVAATLAIGTLSVAVPLILPGLVGVLKQGYAFDDAQLGYLSSADLAGMTLGSAIGAKVVSRTGIQRGTRWGLLLAAFANLASAPVGAFWPLLGLRGLAGIGAGLVVAICYVVLGRSKQVDRNFSFYLICQLLFCAVALQWMPALSAAIGVPGMFTLLAAFFAASLLTVGKLPAFEVGPAPASPGESASTGFAAWMGLAGTLIYFVALSAVWAYFELIGEHGGVTPQMAASGLALSTLVGLLGPGAAALLGGRFGRLGPSVAGVAVGLFSLQLLSVVPLGPVRFTCAACLFNIAWNFTVPFLFGTLSVVDRSGRAVGWAAPISFAGFSLGPVVAAMLLSAGSFALVLAFSAAVSVVSLLGFAPAWTKRPALSRSIRS